MRPQLRSLPLCRVECPQFSWAVRNNSENVSVVLQPDLLPKEQKNEESRSTFPEDDEKVRLVPNKSCYCLDDRLRPTLFPHPVSCVCSNEPSPPKNEKYRYCKLKMDQAIGDVMEEIIMETIPTSPPMPASRTERLMKKIIRSAQIPEQVDLMDENACVECLTKDPSLLKELLDKIKYRKGSEDERNDKKSCLEAGECRKRAMIKDGFDCFEEKSPTEPRLSEDKKCKWKKDTVCTCKELRHDLCVDCDRCKCKCMKSCLKCTCKKGESPKLIDSPKRTVIIEHPTGRKGEEKVLKISKGKKPVVTDGKPMLASPHARKTGGKIKKIKVKSPSPPPKKARAKSPAKKSIQSHQSNLKKPNNIICERFELIEKDPFYHMQEHGVLQKKGTSPVQVYEHYREVAAVRSGSSKSTSAEIPNLIRPKSFDTQKNFIANSLSSSKNPKRVKHKKPVKMPWNWHNQPKVEDPYKNWGGTRCSWSKKLNYATLGRNLEENNEKINRSRGGDDVLVRSEAEEPRYYEYKPNLRRKSFNQIVVADNEEEIKKKEQRRYRNSYGRMRVKSWHQALARNTGNHGKKCEDQPEVLKEKSEFSEDEEHGGNKSDEEDHDSKQCLQCLMSDVQQRFIGSSNNLCPHGNNGGGENTNLEYSTKMLSDPTRARTLDNGDITNVDYGNLEDQSIRRLSTILEENSVKYDCKSDRNVDMDSLNGVEKEDEEFRSGKMKVRPNTAEVYSTDSQEIPFFNVIKQRIHSRNKTLENLDKFRNEIFTKKTDTDHTCVHRFTIDERLFPKPLHCDESGTSCCVHCDKPMTSNEKTVFLDQRESKQGIGGETNVHKQVSKFSLRQKPVYIGAKNSVMEIRLSPEHDDLLKGFEGEKWKNRQFYTNSLALRHQRR